MSQNVQRHQRGNHKVPADLKTPVRNHYFYGKLLDVFHLELEQEYFNSKRRLHNRLITGPGVVCGLKVELTSDYKSITVEPGFAIDRCGREIIVASPSKPYPLPEFPPYEPKNKKGYQSDPKRKQQGEPEPGHEHRYYCEIPFAHVVLCYHECESDPTPAMAGDCETVSLCASGSVREQYSIEVREGFAPKRDSSFPRDIVYGGEVNYRALTDYIMKGCRVLPDDCCIPLANVELVEGSYGWEPEIDNSIRPIVYTNRLLWDLIRSLLTKDEAAEAED